MDNFIIQNNYRSRCLVEINGVVNVYKNEKYKFEKPFLLFGPKNIY